MRDKARNNSKQNKGWQPAQVSMRRVHSDGPMITWVDSCGKTDGSRADRIKHKNVVSLTKSGVGIGGFCSVASSHALSHAGIAPGIRRIASVVQGTVVRPRRALWAFLSRATFRVFQFFQFFHDPLLPGRETQGNSDLVDLKTNGA